MTARRTCLGLPLNNSTESRVQTSPTEGKVDVLHLTSVHSADDSRIFGKECVSLARAGYRVGIVVPEEGTCMRRVDGVDIIPVRRRSKRPGRMLASTISVAVTGLRRRASVYHFHDPELIPIGLALRLLGKRVIYDAHEDVPRDILFKNWIPPYLRRITAVTMAAVEWFTGHTLSGVVAATPIIARRFPARRTALVQNFARLSEFAVPEEPPHSGGHAIAYVGGLTVERCAIEMVEAVARVKRYPDARLILAGNIESEALTTELAAMEGWPRVEYRGFQSRTGVARILSEAAAGLALFHPMQSYMESQPVKMFEYMAAGLPVIAADFPRFRDIIEGSRCGICVPPRNPADIAGAIEWILDHPEEAREMGRRGRRLVLDIFNWEGQEKSLLQLYQRILA
jgi:glycosyltransferase involved in cell wall biosynthesis